MKDIDRTIKCVIDSDLENKNKKYDLIINMENEVAYETRKCAIALAGATIRNNEHHLHGEYLKDGELEKKIQEILTLAIPDDNFKIKSVSLCLKQNKSVKRV